MPDSPSDDVISFLPELPGDDPVHSHNQNFVKSVESDPNQQQDAVNEVLGIDDTEDVVEQFQQEKACELQIPLPVPSWSSKSHVEGASWKKT